MNAATQEAVALGTPLMRDPVWVYDIWSAYTDGFYKDYLQLPDDTRLTEELAMAQLSELARLRRLGVHFDYYMMNAFWFDPDGAYRTWRQPDWPNGPDRWIAACHRQGLKPGLWFGSNSLWKLNLAPAWRDSLAHKEESALEVLSLQSMSFFEGGFLADFMQVLQYWYDRGIRMFEFDVANFDAATHDAQRKFTPEQIRAKNQAAFGTALKNFRARNPDTMLVAFNDFGGDLRSTASPFPFKKPVDLRWLEVFDSLYTGDTRVSDVPLLNFWRSVDLYNDHMTRRYEQSGIPLERTDPFFTLSSTWFGYHRGKQAWKSMLMLSAARGNWKKTIYGDLRLLDDADARWFARVQEMYAPLVAMGRTKSFGGVPGEIRPYGFASYGADGALYTVLNPTQEIQSIDLPRVTRLQQLASPGRALFRDCGFSPRLEGTTLSIGPEQLVVVGYGRYAQPQYDLGLEETVRIPDAIAPIAATFQAREPNLIEATISAPKSGNVRVLVWQRAHDDSAPRSARMTISAEQDGTPIPVAQPDQQRAASTGISWAAGEIETGSFAPGVAMTIRCTSSEKQPVILHASVHAATYSRERTS